MYTQPLPAAEPTTRSRPTLHFTTRSGWINDPLALTYCNGVYHLFYQLVPGQIEWSPRCWWGHATSSDLLQWTEKPPILGPGDGDGGCWSGALVLDDRAEATIFYTSVPEHDLDIGAIRTARPADPDWNRWTKSDQVLDIKPPADARIFRDPQLTKVVDRWLMIVGAGRDDQTATALSYWSDDLQTWTPGGELASRPSTLTEPLWTGTVWECPQLVDLGDCHALMISVWEPWQPHYEAYAIGHLDDQDRFVAEQWHRLSYGDAYYAGSTFRDEHDQVGIIYWLRGVADPDGVWAGAHSVPHLLQRDGTGRLQASPHPNILDMREQPITVRAGVATPLPVVADIEWFPGEDGQLTISDDDGRGVLTIATAGDRTTITTPTSYEELPSTRRVRAVFDKPIVEVFTPDGVFATAIDPRSRLTITIDTGSCAAYALQPPTGD